MNINFIKTTEQDSLYDNLELKSTIEILSEINQEDKTVAYIIEKTIPKIQPLVDIIYKKINILNIKISKSYILNKNNNFNEI